VKGEGEKRVKGRTPLPPPTHLYLLLWLQTSAATIFSPLSLPPPPHSHQDGAFKTCRRHKITTLCRLLLTSHSPHCIQPDSLLDSTLPHCHLARIMNHHILHTDTETERAGQAGRQAGRQAGTNEIKIRVEGIRSAHTRPCIS
jgi:hypothetical protein